MCPKRPLSSTPVCMVSTPGSPSRPAQFGARCSHSPSPTELPRVPAHVCASEFTWVIVFTTKPAQEHLEGRKYACYLAVSFASPRDTYHGLLPSPPLLHTCTHIHTHPWLLHTLYTDVLSVSCALRQKSDFRTSPSNEKRPRKRPMLGLGRVGTWSSGASPWILVTQSQEPVRKPFARVCFVSFLVQDQMNHWSCFWLFSLSLFFFFE